MLSTTVASHLLNRMENFAEGEDMDEDEYPAKKYLNNRMLLNVDKFQSSKKEDLQSIIENYIKEII